MKRVEAPVNIAILELTPTKLKNLPQVTVLDFFEGNSKDFHPQGLFSTQIFGRVGDERRSQRFAYIDIKVKVFHPIIFRTLEKLKRLYGEVMAGTSYAVWNAETKDFEKASPLAGGETGFHFFLKHWEEIEFRKSPSTSREQMIKLIEKYKGIAMTDKVIVMPAGLRDLEFDEHDRISEDEINPAYRRLLVLANTINEAAIENNPEILDTRRYQIQMAFTAIYEMITALIEGKKKLVLNRWASRRTFNGTRNVITAMNPSVPYLGEPGALNFNSTIIGLYQYLKATLPVSQYQIRRFLENVFPDVNQPARLIDKETLKSEEVLLSSRYYNHWATNEGIERVITAYKEEAVRDIPLEIDGRYVLLVYKGPDMTFRVMQSIDELPPDRNKADVHPITLTELLYLSVYEKANSYPMLVTRYPITGVGSIYPSFTYLRVTQKFERRTRLDENWTPMDESHTAREFPIKSAYVNSLMPHSSRLGGLNADFDGDTSSANIAYSDESIAEVNALLSKRRAYIGTDGNFIANTNVMTVQLVVANMTGDAPAA